MLLHEALFLGSATVIKNFFFNAELFLALHGFSQKIRKELGKINCSSYNSMNNMTASKEY